MEKGKKISAAQRIRKVEDDLVTRIEHGEVLKCLEWVKRVAGVQEELINTQRIHISLLKERLPDLYGVKQTLNPLHLVKKTRQTAEPSH